MKKIVLYQGANPPASDNWPAVFSLFMGVTSLIAAEFIPVSLLTPMADDLHITEGLAGQSITAVGIFAAVTSLCLAPFTKAVDRRSVLLALSALLIASNILVGLAVNYYTMLIGRAILGVCVGGFWSIASAVTLRLVSPKAVTRALSVVYAGVSVATLIALPLASYLGYLIGWRNVFFLASIMSAIAFIWQWISLPSLPARSGNGFSHMFRLLKQKWILAGIAATMLSYGGYHLFFTYLRPFLQHDLSLSSSTLAFSLLAFGAANCLGTLLAGVILASAFRPFMIAVHLSLALIALLLLTTHGAVSVGILLTSAWGFAFGFIPVGWSTWITRTLAKEAELMGGLSVAAIQFAIGLAAAGGGALFDSLGLSGIFIAAVIIMLGATVLVTASFFLYFNATGERA